MKNFFLPLCFLVFSASSLAASVILECSCNIYNIVENDTTGKDQIQVHSNKIIVNGFGFEKPSAIRDAYDTCVLNYDGVSITNCFSLEVKKGNERPLVEEQSPSTIPDESAELPQPPIE